MLNFSQQRPKTSHPDRSFNWLSIRCELALSIVLLIAVSHILSGDISLRVLIMLVGSILSIGVLHGLSRGLKVPLFTRVLCYTPYLLGLYIFFIEGFWRLTQILKHFTIWQPGLVIFYFVVGYSLAATGYTAISQAKRLREKR